MLKGRTETYSVEINHNSLTNKIERELWFEVSTGKAHRPNGPADIQYYVTEGRRRRSETFCQQGTVHRGNDLPSIVVIDEATNFEIFQAWTVGAQNSRLGGKPAVNKTDQHTGLVERIEYWEHGQRHRTDGPACIEWDPKTAKL